MTTLWVCEKAGGPYKYISTVPNGDSLDLEPTHYDMKLTEEEFDAAGKVLANTLDHLSGKELARCLIEIRLQLLPIRTAREVFPQAAHPVIFVKRVMRPIE